MQSPELSIRLHANENPFVVPANVWQEIQERLTNIELNRYPGQAMKAFYASLSAHLGYPAEMLLAGNGLEEIILLLLASLGRKGRVILPTPTFFVYKQVAAALGLSILELPLIEDSWQLDIPLILKEVGLEEGLIIICRPNNPTGNVFPREDVLRLLEETQLTVVVDEAYFGFCEETMIEDVARYDRLIVLRTFSKTFGLAGIRLGYMVANQNLVEVVHQVRPAFNLNALTLIVGCVALEQEQQLLARVPAIVEERERLATLLGRLPGVKVYPSETNFLLIKLPFPAQPLWQKLHEDGISVRLVGNEMPQFLRISVGLPTENDLLLAALAEQLNAGGQQE